MGIYLAALVAAMCLAQPVAAENARLPYRLLYTAEMTRANLNRSHTNLVVVLTMKSTQASVKRSDLEVYIDSKSGKLPIEISPTGQFRLPFQEDLMAENPWVIVNQPKGTMKLDWEVALLPGRLTNSLHYARLMGPVRESEQVQEEIRRSFANGPRQMVTGLKLTFPSGPRPATIVIHARDGARNLAANAQQEIVLPLNADLLEEDPAMTLSDIPAAVEIVYRTEGG